MEKTIMEERDISAVGKTDPTIRALLVAGN